MYYSVTQKGDNDYILTIENDYMTIIRNEENQYSGVVHGIDSAVCDDTRLIFTKKESFNLFIYDFTHKNVQEIALSSVVSVIKLFGPDLRYLTFEDRNHRICIFDLIKKVVLFESPLLHEYIDVDCSAACVFSIIGENKSWDDMEDEWVYEMIRRFTYSSDRRIETYSAAYARVFMDTFRDVPIDSYASYHGDIKLPLFDRYFYHWPYYKMLTPHYAIHYCFDIESMIVSSLENGNVICMFKLPKDIKSSDCISFNEESFILTVLDRDDYLLTRYQVSLDNAAALEEMNIMYNDAFQNDKSLRQNEKFKQLPLDSINGCKLNVII